MATSKDKFFSAHRAFSSDQVDQPTCAHPNCSKPGQHKAPKDRSSLHNYVYFCQDHIASYNAQWNYYKGMSPEQVARENDIDLTWRRPRHLFGTRYEDQKNTGKPTPMTYLAKIRLIRQNLIFLKLFIKPSKGLKYLIPLQRSNSRSAIEFWQKNIIQIRLMKIEIRINFLRF